MRNPRIHVDLNETWTRCRAGLPQCVLQLVRAADATPRAAESRRELDEIQIGQIDARRIAHAEDLAEGAHGAITAVVYDDHRERRPMLRGGP